MSLPSLALGSMTLKTLVLFSCVKFFLRLFLKFPKTCSSTSIGRSWSSLSPSSMFWWISRGVMDLGFLGWLLLGWTLLWMGVAGLPIPWFSLSLGNFFILWGMFGGSNCTFFLASLLTLVDRSAP